MGSYLTQYDISYTGSGVHLHSRPGHSDRTATNYIKKHENLGIYGVSEIFHPGYMAARHESMYYEEHRQVFLESMKEVFPAKYRYHQCASFLVTDRPCQFIFA